VVRLLIGSALPEGGILAEMLPFFLFFGGLEENHRQSEVLHLEAALRMFKLNN
jgi:hypothetical protein